jgi:hypothetical protein
MTTRAWPVLLLLLASTARAQIPTSDAVAAHVRFTEGVEHARRGDVALAMTAFEAAYAIRPHFSVLYNIGQAHSALGNPVQAIATFEHYLVEGGSHVTQSRREAVERLIDVERQRVGQVVIHVASPRETRIWLDGSELAAERHDLPISLEVGDHTLLYSHGAGHPVALAFKIVAGQISRQHIPALAAPPPSKARLEVRCDVPDIDVAIDGKVVASTPVLKPLLIHAGLHQVHFARPGFLPFSVDIDVKPDSANAVGCRLRWQARPDASFAARLFVQAAPSDAQVFVDGFAFSGGVLPAGRHLVKVERDGYVPDLRTVWLRPGAGQRHEVTLTPTAAQRQRDTKRRLQRRTLAIIFAGGSASSLVAAGTLYAWNQRRFDELRSVSRDTPGAVSPGRVAAFQRVDDAAIGLGALGVSLAIAATWTLLSGAQD